MADPGFSPPQGPDWKEVLDFVRSQTEKDRSYFDQLFKRTMWAIGLIVAAGIGLATFFGLRSLADMRNEMKKSTQAEVDNMRAEVRKRIESEFQTRQITELVRSVARERAQSEINRVIAAEVSRQVQSSVKKQESEIRRAVTEETQRAVRDLNPKINGIVAKQTGEKIDASLRPFQATLASYREVLHTGTLATAAMNGSRAAYFQLQPALKSQNHEIQEIAGWALTAMEDEKFDMMKAQTLNPDIKPEDLMMLSSSPSPTLRSKAAEAMGKSKDRKYMPRIVELIKSDPNLRVVRAGLVAFVQLTGETIQSDEQGIEAAQKWWEKHNAEFK
jgi:hypothetical protein